MSVLSKNGGAAAAAAPTVRPAVLLSRPYHAALQEAVEAAAPDLRKAEATRLRLLAATARLLEEHGLARLKVTDIADGAGAAHGTFYSYFRDKRDAAEAVLTAFATDCIEAIGAGSGASGTADAYASIRAAIAGIATTYRLNPGLSRCLWQLDDSGTAIEHVVQDINTRWHRRIADSLLRRAALPEAARREATVVAYALAAMVDDHREMDRMAGKPPLFGELHVGMVPAGGARFNDDPAQPMRGRSSQRAAASATPARRRCSASRSCMRCTAASKRGAPCRGSKRGSTIACSGLR